MERLERGGTDGTLWNAKFFALFTFGETKVDNNALRFGTLWNGWNAMERLERDGTGGTLRNGSQNDDITKKPKIFKNYPAAVYV